MKKRKMVVYEAWRAKNAASGRTEQKTKRREDLDAEIGRLGIDDARDKAKEILHEKGYRVRVANWTPDGNLHVVATREAPVQAEQDPHWVWPRPPSSGEPKR